MTFSKAQSSKLERLFCHVSVKRDFWTLTFELWNSIRKCYSKWDWLHNTQTLAYHTHHIHTTECACIVLKCSGVCGNKNMSLVTRTNESRHMYGKFVKNSKSLDVSSMLERIRLNTLKCSGVCGYTFNSVCLMSHVTCTASSWRIVRDSMFASRIHTHQSISMYLNTIHKHSHMHTFLTANTNF